MKEHERAILVTGLAAEGLMRGDVGTILHSYKDGEAFEVEFLTLSGRTIAVATVEAAQLCPVSNHEVSRDWPATTPLVDKGIAGIR